MMGKVIQFSTVLDFRKTYIAPPKKTISALYSLIRGQGIDMYLIKSYDFSGRGTEVDRGRVSSKPIEDITKEENVRCVVFKNTMDSKLDQLAIKVLSNGTDQIHYYSDESGFTAVTVASDYGLVAFAWQDGRNVTSQKGALMVTLLAYAFGYINSNSHDLRMVDLLHSYLPYTGHMSSFTPTCIDLVVGQSLEEDPPHRKTPQFCRPLAAH